MVKIAKIGSTLFKDAFCSYIWWLFLELSSKQHYLSELALTDKFIFSNYRSLGACSSFGNGLTNSSVQCLGSFLQRQSFVIQVYLSVNQVIQLPDQSQHFCTAQSHAGTFLCSERVQASVYQPALQSWVGVAKLQTKSVAFLLWCALLQAKPGSFSLESCNI